MTRAGAFVPNLVTNCTIFGGGKGIETKRAIVLNIVGCMVYQTCSVSEPLGHGDRLEQSQGHNLMKAVCWNGKEDIRVEQVPDPAILNQSCAKAVRETFHDKTWL